MLLRTKLVVSIVRSEDSLGKACSLVLNRFGVALHRTIGTDQGRDLIACTRSKDKCFAGGIEVHSSLRNSNVDTRDKRTNWPASANQYLRRIAVEIAIQGKRSGTE